MKKLIILICVFALLTCSLCFNIKAEELDPAFAEANDLIIYTNPDTNESYYLTRLGYFPNRIKVYSDLEIDVEPYNSGELTDFYGVEVTKVTIEWVEYESADDGTVNNVPGTFVYTLYTTEFYTMGEALALFADNDDFESRGLISGVVHSGDHGFMLGDINNNGMIDSRDYIFLKRAYFGVYELTDERSRLVADVNQNGIIDSRDYVFLKRAYFGTYKLPQFDVNLAE